MRLRGVLTAFSAMLLLTGMFVAVHRGTRGRAIEERIKELNENREAAETRLAELDQEVERLRSRSRIERAARDLGLHVPEGDELVYLFIGGVPTTIAGGTR
jgi:cell division protein FtsL